MMVKWQQAAEMFRNLFFLQFVVLILRRKWIFCRNQCLWCRWIAYISFRHISSSSLQRFIFTAYELVLIDSVVTGRWKICTETARYFVAPANYHVIVNANKSETFQCCFGFLFFSLLVSRNDDYYLYIFTILKLCIRM